MRPHRTNEHQPAPGAEQHHQCVGKGVDSLPQNDAPETVNAVREDVPQHALIAEQVDQRDAGQHRRRKQRQQGDATEHTFTRHTRTLQCIREPVSKRHHNQYNRQGTFQAIAQQPTEIGAAEQLGSGGKPSAL